MIVLSVDHQDCFHILITSWQLRDAIYHFCLENVVPITHEQNIICSHSRLQRPRSFWSAPRIATSGPSQQRKSAIHGLPVTLRMLWVKCDKCSWFWSQSIVFTNPFKTGMSLDLARGRESWCWSKGARPLRQECICSKTRLDGTRHEQTIICRQLFAGHEVDSRPIEKKEKTHWMIIHFIRKTSVTWF